ncbi:phenylalanine--tRNA ligase subunit beta [Methanobrevibacter boviskoreani]|uniref:phenylalanine--tRNA ligase subunit beta n=1 Tax=Methanobrevibacter boviskoreani TaxID=1348249 RepID=UPI0023A8F5AE|nr:phenylalanine--tRNA ligase subunit beta [Methanobrevibacter boviskoreani]MCI6774451.1 phenylalanine--tRNA ligase subunit beta [Methanobrevibacter boviskoreani]MDY5613968.1 phenylalanine--tRNA ligase subunit beta [Methanobrevibacter boviskoreani]
MPVITFEYQDLKDLGIDIEKDKLINTLPMMGSDIEDYNDKEIKVEFFPNRPDNLSIEGVARSLKGFLSMETGLPKYEVEPSGEKVFISKEVENIRPYIAFAKIENVDFTGNKIKYIMDFQENLHWVIGRDRKKVAIGIHNADVVSGDFHYIATEKDEHPFIPLEMDKEYTPAEILEENEKGKKYAHLLEGFDKYPMITDSEGKILSMPPIINGNLTRLEEDTHTIIVDVTGTDKKAVEQSLNIICCSFAEVGGKIKSMEMVYGDKTFTTPDLTPREKTVHVDYTNQLIGGTNLNAEDVKRLLEKARFDAEILNDNELNVKIPPFRIDILHEVDIIENVAIQYCIKKIPSKLPDISTIAYEHDWFKAEKTIRELMVGLGFTEIMSLMLTSEESHYKKMLQEEKEHVQVAKPISVEGTMIRTSLLNTLLEFLEDNKAEDLPQKIFEIGDVLYLDDSTQFNTRSGKKLAAAVCHSNANFTEIKSIMTSVLSNLGYTMEISSSENPSFIKGRVSDVKGSSKNGNIKGVFGEISPEVITNFDLEYPVIAFEIEFLKD